MPYFSSLGDGATVLNILQLHPRAGRALTEYHEIVMRGRSALNESHRELVAAYVSGLNACQYCHGVHSVTAEAFGLPEGAIVALLDDIEAADVEAKLKPILKYVGKLTREPAKMVQADSDAVFAAGWDERALHDAVCVACLFNFMNRLVEGHGVKGNPGLYLERGRILMETGHAPLLNRLDGE